MARERAGRKPFRLSWKLARKIVQLSFLTAFILLFIGSRRGTWPAWLVDLPMRLDPLAMLANAIASRTLAAASLLALLTLLLTILLGRVWCGWICPLGSVLDLAAFKPGKKALRPPSESWRQVKYSLLVAILVAAIVANLSLMVTDPLTLLYRSLSASLWPAADTAFTTLEKALYAIPFLQDPISTVDSWIRPTILPQYPAVYRDGVLYGLVFFAVLGLNFFSPRFWCRYLCPLGAMLGWISKVALIRRQVNDACKSCLICSRACPTGTIDPARHFASDPGECIVCMDCVEDCPFQSNPFKTSLGVAGSEAYDPGRRQVIGVMGATLAGLAVAQSAADPSHPPSRLIQPPGARENDLLSKCIRCGECSRACPTSAIQPAAWEAGLLGFWTPVLNTRLGYCDYSCNSCGQVCPVGAIPPLTLADKRQAILGYAVIDQNRCIAWAQHKPCIVCQEMCPIPDKAITLEKISLQSGGQAGQDLLAPRVLVDRCIGCGICEYRCPVPGQAAIQVQATVSLEEKL